MKTPIGGFFELEPTAAAGGPYHANADLLTSGRSCLYAILKRLRPARVLLPFYICDAVCEPLERLGISRRWYAIDDEFSVQEVELGPGEVLLYVNYFGLQARNVRYLLTRYPGRVILDNTQAFFEPIEETPPAFNSARKFFGVADGAYVPAGYVSELPPGQEARPSTEHLYARQRGEQDLAFRQYREAEKQIACEVLSASTFSRDLLQCLDYEAAVRRRRRNFAVLHAALAPLNRIRPECSADVVPFCYPFLPKRSFSRERLLEREIFFPRLWPEVLDRGHEGFGFEHDLAENLLPLPIDQRYGATEMAYVARCVRGESEQDV